MPKNPPPKKQPDWFERVVKMSLPETFLNYWQFATAFIGCYWMLVVLTCNTLLNKLTTARNQFNNFNFHLSYNVSLSISCLNFRKIKRICLTYLGPGSRFPSPNVQDMQRHTKLFSPASCQHWVNRYFPLTPKMYSI